MTCTSGTRTSSPARKAVPLKALAIATAKPGLSLRLSQNTITRHAAKAGTDLLLPVRLTELRNIPEVR